MSNPNDSLHANPGIILPDQVLPRDLFVIPILGPVLYPTLILPLVVWHPKAIATVEELITRKQNHLGLLMTRGDLIADETRSTDLHPFGIAVKILKRIKLPDGSIQILIQGLKRFQCRRTLSEHPHLVVEPEYFEEIQPEKSLELDALTRSIINHVKDLSETHPFFNEEMKLALINAPHSGVVADIVAFALGLGKADSQDFLETLPVKKRFEKLLVFLKREQDVATVQKKINDEVNQKISTLQREFFLKEQLKLIKKELGMEEEGKDKNARSFRERIETAGMPDDVKKAALDELSKFETLSEQSPEYTISLGYLEMLCSLPWSTATTDQLNLSHAREILDSNHSGLEKVKDRIIEFLAVRSLHASKNKASKKGSIILLVGPPGVGKTSIGKSIATAMGRKFYRFSLGGMRDEAEIKGHRRTYIGAMPGKFIQAAKRAGSRNAVILLDEIDKLASHYHGDPASALLEVLDPEQNHAFLDHYLDLPFDLSQMIFIATANSLQNIPAPLLDRMEIVELTGYTLEEKEQIARRHVLPKVLEETALGASDLKIERSAMKHLILDYAREPGLRILEQLLAKIARKTAAKIVERTESRERLKLPILVRDTDLPDLLGPKRYAHELATDMKIPGVMTGLAWTALGGEILYIEAADLPGSGQLKLTGQMGEVMLESAQIAWTYIKKKLIEEMVMSPNLLKDRDVHIHIPAGAIPKDGPSAGITLACAIYSLFTRTPGRSKTAMTGELSLTGRVLPIGGVREKLLAARRSGVERVILPSENKRDLHDLPIELLRSLDLHFVSRIEEVLPLAIRTPTVKKPTLRARPKARLRSQNSSLKQ
ncbi:MAG: endopeptidase La [Bdellovibrionales bacterium]|nr:endopeptidase La [Bdellovibrionales bacterium]